MLEWFDELHVHQVGAAEIWVVEDKNISRLYRFRPLDHGSRRKLHGSHEYRQSELALSDQLPGGAVIDPVGTVKPLGDDRTESGAHEGKVHLVADLLQTVLNDGKRDGIESCQFGPSRRP